MPGHDVKWGVVLRGDNRRNEARDRASLYRGGLVSGNVGRLSGP